MSCSACVSHVERSAKKIFGEESVTVSLITNSITVTVGDDENEEKVYSQLKKALRAGGYDLIKTDKKDMGKIIATLFEPRKK